MDAGGKKNAFTTRWGWKLRSPPTEEKDPHAERNGGKIFDTFHSADLQLLLMLWAVSSVPFFLSFNVLIRRVRTRIKTLVRLLF